MLLKLPLLPSRNGLVSRLCLIGWMSFVSSTVGAKSPLIIAHRGASGYLPEHTLAAKAAAHAMGADFLEQDLVLSKDNVAVVLHDIYLDTITDVASKFPDRKRTDGRYYALDFTLAELKQLTVSERFNPKTGLAVFSNRFPVRQGAFQIATFEEELQLIQGLNRSTGKQVGIYPEIKAPAWHRREGRDLSKVVLAVLDRYGYRTKNDAVYLQCFEFAETRRLRNELGYAGRLLQLLGSGANNDDLRSPSGLQKIAQVADGIGPALSDLAVGQTNGAYQVTDLVARAHALKLAVHPYTVRADDLPKYARSLDDLHRILLVEAKVDGVFTDLPDRTAAFVRAMATNVSKHPTLPLLLAHAHNDYQHARPLLDALDAGFCSVEADIWLMDGQLLVAHDRKDVTPERTLQSLYLEPLRERIRANGGRVFREVPTVTLMIDVKSKAATTYAVLREVLANYRDVLTEFTGTNTTPRALTAILSGNRPFEIVATESVRYVALDGRLADLDTKVSPHLFPLISDNWQQQFNWRGRGSFPDHERIKLQQSVKRAHEQGCRVRFWGVPDEPAGWHELNSAGVDVIGTDDLSGLAKFLTSTE